MLNMMGMTMTTVHMPAGDHLFLKIDEAERSKVSEKVLSDTNVKRKSSRLCHYLYYQYQY